MVERNLPRILFMNGYQNLSVCVSGFDDCSSGDWAFRTLSMFRSLATFCKHRTEETKTTKIMNHTDFLKIDGSYGEGGGQILRNCCALSHLLSQPIAIENSRKGEQFPA